MRLSPDPPIPVPDELCNFRQLIPPLWASVFHIRELGIIRAVSYPVLMKVNGFISAKGVGQGQCHRGLHDI